MGNPHSDFQYLFLIGGHGMVPDHLHRLARVTRTHLRTGSVVLATENVVLPLAETGFLKGLNLGNQGRYDAAEPLFRQAWSSRAIC